MSIHLSYTRLFLLLAGLFALSALSAQSTWRPAEILTTDGRTISGEAEDRRWQFRTSNIRFRAGEDQPAIRYALRDIESFRIGDRRFVVRNVSINTSPRDRNKLIAQEAATREQITAALLVLREGYVSLYEYTDERSNRHFFISKAGENLRYLDFGRYAMEASDSKTFYREANAFRGTLLRVMSDCFRMRPELLRVKYRREELIKLVDKYYACSNVDQEYVPAREKGTVTFGPDAGLIRAAPTYTDVERPVFALGDLNAWAPVVGAHVKYRFGGPRGAVALRFGVLYHDFSLSTMIADPNDEGDGANSTFRYDYAERAVHFQLGPEVMIIRSRYPVFLETMAEYHRILDYRESRTNTRFENGQPVTRGVFHNFSNQGALSLSAGLGVVVGKARLSLRASATRRAYPSYVLNLYRAGLMASYDF